MSFVLMTGISFSGEIPSAALWQEPGGLQGSELRTELGEGSKTALTPPRSLLE